MDRLHARGAERHIEPALVLLVEPRDFGVLLRKHFDHTRAAQILFEPRRQQGQFLLHRQRNRAQPSSHIIGAMHQKRQRREREQRKARIHPEEYDGGTHPQHNAVGQAQKRAPCDKAHAVDILDGARQNLSGLRAVVVRK